MRLINITVLICICIVNSLSAEVIWQPRSAGIDYDNVTSVALESQDDNIILGINNKIYKSKDNGMVWREIKRLRNSENIKDIVYVSDNKVIIATDQNVYILKSRSLSKKFHVSDDEEILCLYVDPVLDSNFYLGTSKGIYMSSNYCVKWEYFPTLDRCSVYKILINEQGLYIATSKGIFVSNNVGKSWVNIYSYKICSDAGEEEYQEDENVNNNAVKAFFYKQQKTYLITRDKFLISNDNKKFEQFSIKGLPLKDLNDVIFGLDLIAFTNKGVFVFDENNGFWEHLYKGIQGNIAYTGNYAQNGMLFVVMNKGVFIKVEISKSIVDKRNTNILKEVEENFVFEPLIGEVQEEAIKYAEVNKEKIDEWRILARKKALLPDVSFGYNQRFDDTYEIYTAAATSYAVGGPQDETKTWDVSLSWDLGDLVWSSDQTSIDVRSKLMVQLREEVLDEVRRIYFERRREQIELVLNVISDKMKKINMQLRIQELTAGIDAFTGGWFSKEIIKRKIQGLHCRDVAQPG